MNLTLEERERRTYANGDVERAALLGFAASAEDFAQEFDEDLPAASATDGVWAALHVVEMASYGPVLCGPEQENLW